MNFAADKLAYIAADYFLRRQVNILSAGFVGHKDSSVGVDDTYPFEDVFEGSPEVLIIAVEIFDGFQRLDFGLAFSLPARFFAFFTF
jgi:hypothetical protein